MNADQLLAIYASRIQEPPPRGLGRETTTTSQLTEYGQRLFGTDFFRGVFPAGQGPKEKTGRFFFLTNTTDGPPGEHWMAVAVQPGKPPLLFDSFGRKPSASWQPHMRGVAITDPDHNQSIAANNCGQLSLAFGMVFLHHGYEVAKWV